MSNSTIVLDTSIQVDRCKGHFRAHPVEQAIEQFDFSLATAIGLLEFKAVLIGECLAIHARLLAHKHYFWVRGQMCEATYYQSRLRAHIFNVILNVLIDTRIDPLNPTREQEQRMAEKARLHLDRRIPQLYDWFKRNSTNEFIDPIGCDRAAERPIKRRKRFATNLPECRRNENKTCRIEQFIREDGARILDELKSKVESLRTDSNKLEQLSKTIALFERVIGNNEIELTVDDCRSAGDCLIGMEAIGKASHALSTNAREWEIIAPICGLQFVRMQYPKAPPAETEIAEDVEGEGESS